MKARFLYLLTIAVATVLYIGASSASVEATTTNYRLEMWIAPLECTRNEVADGITTNIILTPQQCDEFLYPVSQGVGGGGALGSVPQAPNTGVFKDTWTTVMTVVVILALTTSIITLVVRDLRSKSLKIRQD